jgi:hypothetical protein
VGVRVRIPGLPPNSYMGLMSQLVLTARCKRVALLRQLGSIPSRPTNSRCSGRVVRRSSAKRKIEGSIPSCISKLEQYEGCEIIGKSCNHS